MPLNPKTVGETTAPFTHDADARWIMSYAGGLHDTNPRYMDTELNGPVRAHPVFPVCLEWPVILACRHLPGSETITPEEAVRSVHASHDLHIYRPIRAGDRLTTTGTVIALETKTPGACQYLRLDTHDAEGELVCRTFQLGISRGVEILGEARLEEGPPPPNLSEMDPSDLRIDIPVAAEAAHVYTECARIWNPIHTDRAVAIAAGLPDIILHGTATLALAVSALVDNCLGGDPRPIHRLGCRFSAMVLMPSIITLAVTAWGHDRLTFEVLTEDGQRAISHGFLCWQGDAS